MAAEIEVAELAADDRDEWEGFVEESAYGSAPPSLFFSAIATLTP